MDLGYSNILMEKMTESRYFGETLYITLLCFSNFSRFYNRRCGVHLSHFLDVL